MKKYFLLIIFHSLAVLTFGQTLQNASDALATGSPVFDKNSGCNSFKTGGNSIWETTFNWKNPADPKGWSMPAGWSIVDNAGLGNLWVWRNDTIKGNYTSVSPPSWFTSAADGFICLPMDEYNSRGGVTTSTPSDSYIETPRINCSAVSSVVVRFNQYFRFCCKDYNLQLLVTTDGGLNWATYDAKFGVAGNTFTPEAYRSVEINISDVAAGLANVQLRFYMHGPKSYFWMIDDLKLTEAYQHNLVLEDTWLDFDGGFGTTVGHVNYWPLSQMGKPGATSGIVGNYFFKAAFLNNGMADAQSAKLNVKVLKNGTSVHYDLSPGKNIWSLTRDTMKITNPYLATDFGDYRFDFTASSDNLDEYPDNNSVSLFFTANDTLAHRADFSAESSSNTSGWFDGNNKGDMVGVSYDIYSPTEINSITAYIAGYEPAQNPQFQFVLMKDVEGTYVEWLASSVVNMNASYRHRWVTLPMIKDGETEFLLPGNYVACVRMWGTDPLDTAKGSNGLSVGWDMTTKPTNTLMYLTSLGAWYKTGKLNMIGFNISSTGAPTQAPATFNVDMTNPIAYGEFKPGIDFVDIAGSFNNWTGSAHLTDPEADGIYSITLPGMPVAKVIEYKYRINGNWNSSEYPNGGPNRKYTVRYWNILNDKYNEGVSGVSMVNNQLSSVNAYPNPSSGLFNVEITSEIPTDLLIILTDIQGRIMHQKKVICSSQHQEIIDKNLAKGLYFLTVNNGKEVTTKKVIIQ